jgi:hypothetical protein
MDKLKITISLSDGSSLELDEDIWLAFNKVTSVNNQISTKILPSRDLFSGGYTLPNGEKLRHFNRLGRRSRLLKVG